jgi:hypothetical protein
MNKLIKIGLGMCIVIPVYGADPPVNKTGIYGLTREETIQQRNQDRKLYNPYNTAPLQNLRNESFKWTGDPTYFENNGTFNIKPHPKTNSN